MVEIVLGPRKTGKTHHLIKKVNECIKRGEEVYYLVPEHVTLDSEISILKELEIIRGVRSEGLILVQVISFTKLGQFVMSKNSKKNRPIIDEMGEVIILKKILKENEENLKYFKKINISNESIKDFLSFLEELKNTSWTFEKVKKLKGQGDLIDKLKEAYFIIEKVIDALGENFYEKSLKIRDYTEIIAKSDFLEEKNIFIDDFYNFNDIQLDLVKVMAKKSKNMTIALFGSRKKSEVFSFVENIELNLIKYLKENSINYNKIILDKRYYKSKDLEILDRSYTNSLSKDNYIEDKRDSIHIEEALTVEDEVKNLFENILKSKAIDHNDRKLLIVINDIPKYENLLKIYSDIYSIPIFLDVPIKISMNFGVRLPLDLLKINLGYTTETILDLIDIGFIDVSPEEIYLLKEYLFKYKINDWAWKKEFIDNRCEEIRIKVLRHLKRLEEFPKVKIKGKEFVLKLYKYFNRVELFKFLDQRVDNFKLRNAHRESFIAIQSFNAFQVALESIYDFLSEDEFYIDEIIKLLEDALNDKKIKILPTYINQIEVTDSRNAFKESPDIVFVLGMEVGVYPKENSKNIYFPLDEIEDIEEVLSWKKSRKWLKMEEDLEEYFLLTTPSERIYISYVRDSVDDKDKIIHKIMNLFPKLKIKLIESDSLMSIDTNMLKFQKVMDEFRIGKISDGEVRIEKKLFDLAISLPHGENIIESETKGLESREKLLIEKIGIFSVSKIEEYNQCPYSYFIKYVMGINSVDEENFTSMDLGNIFHKALEMLGREYMSDISAEGDYKEIGKDAIDRCIDKNLKYKFDIQEKEIFLEKIKDRDLLGIIEILKESRRENLEPKLFELRFPSENDEYNLTGSGIRVPFKGTIDRVDIVDNKYLNIIDYKTKGKKLELSNIYDGVGLQPYIYKDYLEKHSRKYFDRPYEVGGIYYLGIKEDLSNTISFDSEQKFLDKYKKNPLINFGRVKADEYKDVDNKNVEVCELDLLVEKAKEIALSTVIKIQKGDFKPYPYNLKCRYCNFNYICRFDMDNGKTKGKSTKKEISEKWNLKGK